MGRRTAAWVAMMATALVLGTVPAATGSAPVTAGDDRPLLIGDSIAASVAAPFSRQHPDFAVDAVPGRRVVTLPVRLRRHLADVGVPSVLVIEMGTNTVGSWTKADYEAVVAMVPTSTRIVMVTPYVRPNHGPASLPRGSRAALRTRHYTRWEYELAQEHANVCVDPWRATVLHHPALLTSSGVHPTATGKRVFLDLLDRTLARCRG